MMMMMVMKEMMMMANMVTVMMVMMMMKVVVGGGDDDDGAAADDDDHSDSDDDDDDDGYQSRTVPQAHIPPHIARATCCILRCPATWSGPHTWTSLDVHIEPHHLMRCISLPVVV